MKKANLSLGLEYNAIPNNINKINTDTEDERNSVRANGMGLKYLFLCFLSTLFFWATPTNT